MSTHIICRFDSHKATPVVFFPQRIEGGTIPAWLGEVIQGKPSIQRMPMSYYQQTQQLSADDEQVILKRYQTATGDQDVVLRQRLPRVPRAVRAVLNQQQQANNGQQEGSQRRTRQRKFVPNIIASNGPRQGSMQPKQAPVQPAPAAQGHDIADDIIEAIKRTREEYVSKMSGLMKQLEGKE